MQTDGATDKINSMGAQAPKEGRQTMKNLGSYPVFIGGYKHNRVVKQDDNGKYWCKWYGEMIEVVRGMGGYFHSLERY